jgi:cytochrome c-type biogenesis protein CcmE
MPAPGAWLGWAMWTIGDVLEGVLRFVRETGAPLVAAVWAVGAFLVAAVLIRLRRDDFGWKLGASLLAFGGAAGSLLWWSLQPEASYYIFADEVGARTQALRLRRAPVRVNGCVVRDSLEQRRGTNEYRFRIAGRPDLPRGVIEARYTGSLPDSFRSGIHIVARGALAADGSLDIEPDGIVTACPRCYAGVPRPQDPWPTVSDCWWGGPT